MEWCTFGIALLVGSWLVFTLFNKLYGLFEVNLKGRAVFITGCDIGLGRLTAQLLDDRKDVVVFAGCLTDDGMKRLDEDTSERVCVVKLDVTSEESIAASERFVRAQLKERGLTLWAVINNAGIMDTSFTDWCSMSTYERSMDVNFFGTVRVAKAFLPLLKKSHGRVINISSIAGRISSAGLGPYSASKYAVEAFSDALRAEMKPFKVDVCLIEPGFTRTTLVTSLSTKAVERFRALPKSVQEEYGEEFLQHGLESLNQIVTTVTAEPLSVVRWITHAVATRNPRPRYVLGVDANYFWVWIARLPEVIGETIMALAAPRPLPAACKR